MKKSKIKKVLKTIVILFLILCAGLMFLMYKCNSNNKQLSSNEEILKSTESEFEKAIIIYQPSSTNVVTDVAHNIAKGLNSKGYEVTMNYPGDYIPSDLSNYSVVVFGTPTYGGTPLQIMKDFIKKVSSYSDNAKIAVFSTGVAKEMPELDILSKQIEKDCIKHKFSISDKNRNDEAYTFGESLAN